MPLKVICRSRAFLTALPPSYSTFSAPLQTFAALHFRWFTAKTLLIWECRLCGSGNWASESSHEFSHSKRETWRLAVVAGSAGHTRLECVCGECESRCNEHNGPDLLNNSGSSKNNNNNNKELIWKKKELLGANSLFICSGYWCTLHSYPSYKCENLAILHVIVCVCVSVCMCC